MRVNGKTAKTLVSLLLLILFMILMASCSGTDQENESEKEKAVSEEDRIAEIVGSMTIEEKVGQMMIGGFPDKDAAWEMRDYQLGGYTFYRTNFNHREGGWLSREELKTLLDECSAEATVAPLFAVDEEGGEVTRLSENPDYFPDGKSPSPRQILDAEGVEGLKKDTAEKSAILKELGISVNFAPVADLVSDKNAIMYSRSMGSDPEEVSEYVSIMVKTMEESGMGSVLKHFPGYGNNEDTHMQAVADERPYEEYRNRDFLPFQAGIEAGCGAVMLSHIRVRGIDDAKPASISPKVVKELRDTLGFDGVIMTDDIAMSEMMDIDRDGRVAVDAVKAGNDMVISSSYKLSYDAILKAVESEEIDEARLDESVYRIIRWKLNLGIIK